MPARGKDGVSKETEERQSDVETGSDRQPALLHEDAEPEVDALSAEHEADAEPRLDPEVEARRLAALSQVRTFGDPALTSKAREVVVFDEALREEVARMGRLMADALGVGLAATQLGVMHRVLVYRPSSSAPLIAVVNPHLEWESAELEVAEEGCLSLPGVAVDVERPVHVRVGANDEHGEKILLEASGLEARVIQHEMDHLDGVLILARTTREQRGEALRILREGPGEWSTGAREAAGVSRA